MLEPYHIRNEKLLSDLQDAGFSVLRAFTQQANWTSAFSCQLINHATVLKRLQDDALPSLNNLTGWDAVLTKFRASSACELKSSNATDAAALHRDIAVYTDTVPPIFTLVIYLDNAQLDLVPKSHTNLSMPIHQSAVLPLVAERQSLRAGDAVLFHATMLHSGVFPGANNDRRVIQCFDIFPTPELAAVWAPKMLHLWCPNNQYEEQRGESISKLMNMPFINSLAKIMHAMRSGGGYRLGDTTLPEGIDILSGEAMRKRIDTNNAHEFQYGNVYVPVLGDIRNATPEENFKYRAQFYSYKSEILGTLVYLLGICTALWLAVRILSPEKKVTSKLQKKSRT